jgi:hypothetical protein
MRKFAARSLFTITAMTTAILAVAMPMRSQPSSTVEISRPTSPPVSPQINSSSKKTNIIKMFEDITIASSAAPQAIELRGISGGTVETQKKSGRKVTETGECIGFIDNEPDHRITLTKPLRFLQMRVKSSGDTILLVRGPGGSWCSDDVSDRNPEISGDWLEGTYEVWIGSYEENASFPYLLQVSTKP